MLQAFILLINSLFVSTPSIDAATMNQLQSSYTAGSSTSIDPATGSAIVSNPDGSIIVIDPSETN
jgi:hypothetical protein